MLYASEDPAHREKVKELLDSDELMEDLYSAEEDRYNDNCKSSGSHRGIFPGVSNVVQSLSKHDTVPPFDRFCTIWAYTPWGKGLFKEGHFFCLRAKKPFEFQRFKLPAVIVTKLWLDLPVSNKQNLTSYVVGRNIWAVSSNSLFICNLIVER